MMIAEKSDPPVCKIVDYGKLRYQKDKKKKEQAKKAKTNEIKEVKMSYKIGEGDYDVRKKRADKFIKNGNRVKLSIQFRGREQQHMSLGDDLIARFIDDLEEAGANIAKTKTIREGAGSDDDPVAEVVSRRKFPGGGRGDGAHGRGDKTSRGRGRLRVRRFSTVRSIAAAADRRATAPRAREDTGPRSRLGVRARFLELGRARLGFSVRPRSMDLGALRFAPSRGRLATRSLRRALNRDP